MLAAIVSNELAFRSMVRGLMDGLGSLDALCEMGLNGQVTGAVEKLSPDLVVIDARGCIKMATELSYSVSVSKPLAAIIAIVENAKDPEMAPLIKTAGRVIVLDASVRAKLLDAIREAGSRRESRLADGGVRTSLGHEVSGQFVQARGRRPITPREAEILRLVAEGKKNSEIAAHFGLSDQTVKAHLANIYFRMGVRGRTAAALLGARNGWLESEQQPIADVGSDFSATQSAPSDVSVLSGMSSRDARMRNLGAFGVQREEVGLLLGHMLDEVGEGCWLIDDGRVAFANATLASMFGYSQRELLGMPFYQVLPPRLRAPIRQLHGMRLSGRRVPTRYSVTAERRNGTLFVAQVSVSAVWHKGKRLVVATVSDARERYAGEDDILHWLASSAV